MINTDPTPTPSPAPSAEPTTTPTTPTGGDTTPSSSGEWFNSLSEEYRSNEKIKSFKSQDDLAKSWVEAQSLIGKKGAIRPEEGAGQDAWNEYYTSIGRPESTEGYKFDAPEGASFDADIQKSINEKLFGMGITEDQYGKLMPIYMEEVSRLKTASDEALNAQKSERNAQWGNDLKQTWGENFDGNAKVVNEFMNKPDNTELMNALVDAGLNNNPKIANMILDYTRATSEDTVVGKSQGGSLEQRKNDLSEKINGMKVNHPDRQKLILERRKIYEDLASAGL